MPTSVVLAAPNVVVNAHPPDDLASGAAYVDVVTLVAALWESLHDRGLPTTRGELMGECGSGNAGAGDQRVGTAHQRCISPLPGVKTPSALRAADCGRRSPAGWPGQVGPRPGRRCPAHS